MNINYLKIIGRLTENKTLKIRHSYMVQRPDITQRVFDSPLQAVCISPDGKVLNSTPILALPYELPTGVPKDLAVRAFIPIPPDTKTVRFTLAGDPILDLPIPETPPKVTVNWEALLATPRAQGKKQISWAPATERIAPYRSYYEYSNDGGKTWRRLPHMVKDQSYEIDLDRLPGGQNCKLALVVTDGVLVTRRESPSFANRIKPCVPMIFRPADGATFVKGEPVELIGQGFDREEQKSEQREIKWESSKDGLLGTGQIVQVPNLSAGEHTITLTACKDRRAGSQSVNVKVIS